jgi:hypothetical protein
METFLVNSWPLIESNRRFVGALYLSAKSSADRMAMRTGLAKTGVLVRVTDLRAARSRVAASATMLRAS